MGSVQIGLERQRAGFLGKLALGGGWLRRGNAGGHWGARQERTVGDASAVASPTVSGTLLDDNVWPENPHEVPKWRIEQERYAAVIGIKLPPYRTRAEHEAAVARCEALLIAADAELPFPPLPIGPFANPCLPTLATSNGVTVGAEAVSPTDAAIAFRDWLIANNHTGKWSSEELSGFYLKHCTELRRQPTPENVMRAALKRIGHGISKHHDDTDVHGKRVRSVVWIVDGDAPMTTRKPNERAERKAA